MLNPPSHLHSWVDRFGMMIDEALDVFDRWTRTPKATRYFESALLALVIVLALALLSQRNVRAEPPDTRLETAMEDEPRLRHDFDMHLQHSVDLAEVRKERIALDERRYEEEILFQKSINDRITKIEGKIETLTYPGWLLTAFGAMKVANYLLGFFKKKISFEDDSPKLVT